MYINTFNHSKMIKQLLSGRLKTMSNPSFSLLYGKRKKKKKKIQGMHLTSKVPSAAPTSIICTTDFPKRRN